MRRLPWDGPEGKPAYLSADGRHSRLSRMADEVERAQLDTAQTVVRLARELLNGAEVAALDEVRFAALRLIECLTDTLRVAESRMASIPTQPDDPD
ncbi:hypothetical protein [Streptomyces halobius]|uniref:Uncharacterized protein n=1 Tax=Streptomyces halobius TaxID=2879846 RepID=A0ABY4MJF4_9ACTN|nr:hypothetical protein [Streptomyces halobius]UQA97812.1 hypothetical protein K9S39_17900 [Streptomyces halobius]